jgi:glycosyltransferase involved in cell wall biosynthesis
MLSDRFPPEVRSAAHLFHELAAELVRRGHDVAVITKAPRGYVTGNGTTRISPGWSDVEGVRTLRVRGFPIPGYHPLLRGLDHLTLGWTFGRAARRWPAADIVLVYSPPLPLALAGAAYRRRFGTRLVLNVQDLYPQTAIDLRLLTNHVAIRLAERLEGRAYAVADRIVVHSPGNSRFLVERKGIASAKVRVIHNWVDTEVLRPGPRENNFRVVHDLTGKFVVSYAGVMGYAQDLSLVIEAARRLRVNREILFLLVGEGVLEQRWRERASGLENVRFLPMQPKQQYVELLAASDVCLVPLDGALRTPVVPGKLQSILACGRPAITITAPDSDALAILAASGGGVSVAPGDVAALEKAIGGLLVDPARAERMGASGRRYAELHFSLTECANCYEEIFADLKGRRV